MPLGVDAASSPDTIESITGEKKKKNISGLATHSPWPSRLLPLRRQKHSFGTGVRERWRKMSVPEAGRFRG